MTLVKGLVEDLFEDIADVTLIYEDTKPILTDDANKEILSNMEVAPPVDQLCNKATPIMVSTHVSVVPPAMFDNNV